MANPNFKTITAAKAEVRNTIARFTKQGFKIVEHTTNEYCRLEFEGCHPRLTIIARPPGSTIVTVKQFDADASTNSWIPREEQT